jgi:hypothetical protein
MKTLMMEMPGNILKQKRDEYMTTIGVIAYSKHKPQGKIKKMVKNSVATKEPKPKS